MRVTATLLTFGEDTYPDIFGDVVTFAEGSLYLGADRLPLLVQHNADGPVVGYADPADVWTENGQVRATFTLLDTPAAAQTAAELSAGVRWDVSVGVNTDQVDTAPNPDAPEHPVFGQPLRATVQLADLVETSLVLRGRMPSAQVDQVTTDPTTTTGVTE